MKSEIADLHQRIWLGTKEKFFEILESKNGNGETHYVLADTGQPPMHMFAISNSH